MSKQKGSAFERHICGLLSSWWSEGIEGTPRTDVFWRSTTSGARATMRSKKGLKTKYQDSDITATDPIGLPLLNLIVFEAKRGYTAFSSQDLLDYESVSRTQSWIDQAEASRVNAGAAYWAVISKKDRREAVILMPTECFFEINQNYVPLPLFLINLKDDINLVQFLFNDFLKFDPKHIKKVSDDKQINNKELSKTSTLRDRLTKNQCLGGEV